MSVFNNNLKRKIIMKKSIKIMTTLFFIFLIVLAGTFIVDNTMGKFESMDITQGSIHASTPAPFSSPSPYIIIVRLFFPDGSLAYQSTLTMQQYLNLMETGNLDTNFVFDRAGTWTVVVIVRDIEADLSTYFAYTINVTAETPSPMRKLGLVVYPYDEAGSVTGSGYYIMHGLITTNEYGYGVFMPHIVMDVIATVNEGYKFLGWYDGEERLGSNKELSFYMPDRDLTLVARFEKQELIDCDCCNSSPPPTSCFSCGTIDIGSNAGFIVLSGLIGIIILSLFILRKSTKKEKLYDNQKKYMGAD